MVSSLKEVINQTQLNHSELLSQLDISLFERCLTISDSIQAVDEFEQEMIQQGSCMESPFGASGTN
ncbi:MAG: hypothetical protein QNJ47_02505 [Nostocaceae cyanobacterium]|nr:hypothetical protein [Nostocaceae cyanobacterium]